MSKFEELAAIDCAKHIEKKNGLSYLSWAWAIDTLLRLDPAASWEYLEPKLYGETMMVFCTVTAFGLSRTAHLPVMDYRNKAISNPDSFAVNTAMQRCLVKAIAMHGLGLYIYAGEDLPPNQILTEPITPSTGVEESISDERKKVLADIVTFAREFLEQDDYKGCLEFLETQCLEVEEKIAVFKTFSAAQRRKLKDTSEDTRRAA